MVPNPLWLPILASAIAFTMLPIAYLAFLILNNKRSYLGDAVGRGWRRTTFNAILVVALAMAVVGAGIRIKTGVVDKIWPPNPAAVAR
jgi:succinate dehydrogenase hydrophobic anchor subunit